MSNVGHPPPGLVHIEAALNDDTYANSYNADQHEETSVSGIGAGGSPAMLGAGMGAGLGAGARLGTSNNAMTTTHTSSSMTYSAPHPPPAFDETDGGMKPRSYSTGASLDGPPSPNRNRQRHASYDNAPVVELNSSRGDQQSKIGATLFQPYGITGEAHPQNVISGRDSYHAMIPGGYDDADTRGMSTLGLQNEILYNELRPDSVYEYGGGGNGYHGDEDSMYQGEIRLGSMGQPLNSPGSDNVHETRFL